MAFAAGEELDGRYRVVRPMGGGGMGTVWEVEHLHVGRRFALKVLRPELCQNADLRARFQREPRLAADIGSPHIVDVTDAGALPDGSPYIVMELLRGESLAVELSRVGRIETERCIEIVAQCCEALGAAHARGIVHRDVKPDNVFVVAAGGRPRTPAGQPTVWVKLLDFGIAKNVGASAGTLTASGFAVGTLPYMSPEQVRSARDIDGRSDLYSLGVVLFQMLTGRLPFGTVGDSESGLVAMHQVIGSILGQPAPRVRDLVPSLAPGLEAVVARALEKHRELRFADAAEMALALAGTQTAGPSTAPASQHPTTVFRAPTFEEPSARSGARRPKADSALSAAPDPQNGSHPSKSAPAPVPLRTPAAWQTAPATTPSSPWLSRMLVATGLACGLVGLGMLGLVAGRRLHRSGRAVITDAAETASPRPPQDRPRPAEPDATRGHAPPARAGERDGGLARPQPLRMQVHPGPATITTDQREIRVR